MRRVLSSVLALLLVASAAPALAQSQAANGAIEGTVRDSSGGVLPGVTVEIVNIDTGTQRIVVTNESGLYRAVLLPLGTLPADGRTGRLQEARARPASRSAPARRPRSTSR